MLAALDVVGNPSSPHAEGRRARAHHRGCARAGCRAGRRQAGRGRLHQRRHGGQQRRAGRAAGTRSCWPAIEHDSRAGAGAALPARRSIAAARRRRRRRATGMAATASGRRDGAAGAARCWRCRWPTTRPACCSRSPRWPRLARGARRSSCTRDAVQAAGRIAVDFAALGVDYADALRATSSAAPRASARWSFATATSLPAAHRAAAARSGAAARAPRTSPPSPASARRPRRRSAISPRCSACRRLRDRLEARPAQHHAGSRRSSRRGAPRLPNTTVHRAAGHSGRDAGDRARSGGHRRERGRGLLVGQGRRQPRAGGDGAGAERRARRPSASASGREHRRSATSRPSSAAWSHIAVGTPRARGRVSKTTEREQGQSTMPAVQQTIDQVRRIDVDQYKYGFETDIEIVKAPKGLDEDTVRFISAKKGEPDWMLEWRLEAYPALADHDRADLGQGALPQDRLPGPLLLLRAQVDGGPKSLADVDPELLRTYEKLGIPLKEQEILAGVQGRARGRRRRVRQRVGGHHLQGGAGQGRRHLLLDLGGAARASRAGAEVSGLGRAAVRQLLRRAQLGGVLRRLVRLRAARACAARWSCRPTSASTRSRPASSSARSSSPTRAPTCPTSRAARRRCATRTSCTPRWSSWSRSTTPRSSTRPCRTGIPGDKNGKGGIYNFVTKRGDCRGRNSKISWTQVETGSAITWKYPSCILRGDNSRGEFYSIAVSNGYQQVDSGTKMIHLGKNTSSRIISKGIAAGPLAEHLSRPRLGAPQGHERAQLHQLRFAADRRQVRRPHRALYRGQERHRAFRARGDDVEDLRRQAVLLPAARACRRRRRWR